MNRRDDPSPGDRSPLPLPDWAGRLAPDAIEGPAVRDGIETSIRRGDDPPALRIDMRVPDAMALPADELESVVHRAYRSMHRLAADAAMPTLVRYWAFIPSIHHEPEPGVDIYRVFNAGRYKAFLEIHGDEDRWGGRVASSTGIGHDAAELRIHGLAAPAGAVVRHLHNPRQRPPHAYSSRYGALPPCFARATLADLGGSFRRILISGTASIRGEESLHDTLAAQTDETMTNIDELIRVACHEADPAGDPDVDPERLLLDLQAYYRRPEDASPLREQLDGRLQDRVEVTLLRADVCRPELLVEIEGTAEWPVGRGAGGRE